jgi:hypothetical protein
MQQSKPWAADLYTSCHAQQIMMMASTDQVGPSLSHTRPATSPSSPNFSSTEHVVTFSYAQQLLETIEAIMDMEIASTASKCKCPQTTS